MASKEINHILVGVQMMTGFTILFFLIKIYFNLLSFFYTWYLYTCFHRIRIMSLVSYFWWQRNTGIWMKNDNIPVIVHFLNTFARFNKVANVFFSRGWVGFVADIIDLGKPTWRKCPMSRGVKVLLWTRTKGCDAGSNRGRGGFLSQCMGSVLI